MATGLAPGFRYSGQAKHRLSYDQVKRLAQAFGLPGDAIAQISKGESGMYADVQQRDPGDGMVGYGLLQMTPNAWGKGSAAYKHMQALGGVQAMKDPVKNMAMARFLYKSAGNKLTPWYGTKFLTNRSGEGSLGPVDPNKAAALASMRGTTAPATTTQIPGQTITTQIPTVDKTGFEQARKLAIVGGLIARRNPNSFLLRSGLLSTQEPTLSSFMGSRTVKDVIPGATVRTPAGSTGSAASTSGFAKGHSPLLELIHKGDRPYAVKNGRKVSPSFYSAVWDNHANHVHVAAGPKTVVELGKLAQQMGLHVGENPHFGGVAPVHSPHSYHYRGEAIDVSGDPRKMNAYARRVQQLYGVR
jgi:hypothetical protein